MSTIVADHALLALNAMKIKRNVCLYMTVLKHVWSAIDVLRKMLSVLLQIAIKTMVH
jgi:hypothetical protein